MALQHIQPNRFYSAQGLYDVAEGEPFKYHYKKWINFLLKQDSGLKFIKGAQPNSAYRILGQDYLSFININTTQDAKIDPR